jgi:DNA polymerase-1
MKGLFQLPPRATKAGDLSLVNKLTKPTLASKGVTVRQGRGIMERIPSIRAMANRYLGQYADIYRIIQDERELEDYITKAIEDGELAIDTETNGLDFGEMTIAGLCLYSPSQTGAYVPLNHVSYITMTKLDGQLSEQFVAEQLARLVDTKLIFFNAKFDIRVINQTLGVELIPYWDGYIGARLLNENEPDNGLKALHNKYVLKGEGESFNYDSIFKGIPFSHIPINIAYLYAAHDAVITYELYKFQQPFLTKDHPTCIERHLQGVAYVFREIEMPLINIVAQMEDTGIALDLEYAKDLEEKYGQELVKVEQEFFDELAKYKDDIDQYRKQMGPACKLDERINLNSPTQLAILLYDVLGIAPVDNKSPRGTGEDILEKINIPLTRILLEYRRLQKLMSTYITKLPASLNPRTGRLHASFNQMGTDTGRFSSTDPNMQNIPARNKDIRQMFIASPGYCLLSSDYSQQEPRLTAHMSRDEKLINAYKQGKDLYVEIASIAFHLPYEDCMEFKPDGTYNPEGAARRQRSKAIVLGVCYGKGVPAIAEDLGISKEEAQQIYDQIMRAFPGLERFMIESQNMARELGYVDTVWGRKRRLPNMQLDPYEFSYSGKTPANFDPLAFDQEVSDEVPEGIKRKYLAMLNRASWSEKQKIIAQARNEGIIIKDNGGLIAEATRQCVNSRIQGSAADMTKKAMLLVGKDVKLKEWGFRLLLTVHDELIGECPKENAKQVAERFSALMIEAAKDLDVPSKCDVVITERWYGDPLDIT